MRRSHGLPLRLWLAVASLVLSAFADAARARADTCTFQAPPAGLEVRAGHVAFMTAARLGAFTANLPHVEDAAVEAALRGSETMWYDEASMVFAYQDAVEFVVGLRANCVGRAIAERSVGTPVERLGELFGEDFRFRFPFRTAAGIDDTTGTRLVNFWLPPRGSDGKALPVRWWKESARGRWRWLFPVGTLFGEILYVTAPDGTLFPVEVRARTRYRDGWRTNAYRPYPTAASLVSAIEELRPDWRDLRPLSALVAQLEGGAPLAPKTVSPGSFASALTGGLDGALDVLPDMGDEALVRSLLTTPTFRSAAGLIWREDGAHETYAPSSSAAFGIAPKGSTIGLIAVNDDSCNRCHDQTGRELGDFIPDVSAYGEVWGDDRIFTWHPFEPSDHIYGPWDDQQTSRVVSSRFNRAGLLLSGKPAADDPLYHELPKAWGMAR